MKSGLSITAKLAPLLMASFANLLALKFGPFKAKKIDPGIIFLVSVDTVHLLLMYLVYNCSII